MIDPTRRAAVVLSADAIGLGAVRSLAAGDVPVLVLMQHAFEPVRFSRFGTKRVIPPSADIEHTLLRTLRTLEFKRRPVLLPTTDWYADFCARHREILDEHFRVAVPGRDVMLKVMDKAQTGWLADARIPHPRTMSLYTHSALEAIETLGLPLLIKPRTYLDKRELGWRNVVVDSREHLEEFCRTALEVLPRVVAQEMIPGPDTDLWECIGVFDEHSELVSSFTFRKLRTMPAHYGQTSFGRSERNERILEMARVIGKRLRYTGPFDIDLKYDARDDTYQFLELNPRLGMCHNFGTRCGVNLALDAWRIAAGELVPEDRQQDGRLFLSVPEDIGARVVDGESVPRIMFGTLMALLRRPVGAYFAWNDPLPGPLAMVRLALRLIAKAKGGQLASVFTKDMGRRAPPPRTPRQTPHEGEPRLRPVG